METIMNRAEIDRLNTTAHMLTTAGATVREALYHVADEAGLTRIATEDNCEIYRDGNGHIVNCWLEGPGSAEIEDGGAGFDNQVQWYTERELADA